MNSIPTPAQGQPSRLTRAPRTAVPATMGRTAGVPARATRRRQLVNASTMATKPKPEQIVAARRAERATTSPGDPTESPTETIPVAITIAPVPGSTVFIQEVRAVHPRSAGSGSSWVPVRSITSHWIAVHSRRETTGVCQLTQTALRSARRRSGRRAHPGSTCTHAALNRLEPDQPALEPVRLLTLDAQLKKKQVTMGTPPALWWRLSGNYRLPVTPTRRAAMDTRKIVQ